MATNTSILGLTKPAYTDDADVAVINSNSDLIDAEAGRTRANFAAEYSTSSAYAVGAFCTHAGILYQCNTAIGSGGEAWTAAHWTQISAAAAINANTQAIANYNAFRSEGDSIKNNDNLNDITTPGLYYCNNKTTTNKPTGAPDYYHLLVFGLAGGTVIQMFFYLGGGLYIRGRYSNSWDNWLAIEENFSIDKYITTVQASVTLASIGANSYASDTVDVDTPAGKTHAFIAPQYTSNGFPVAGAYVTSGAPAGKTRFTIGVYNFTSSALSNITATIRILFY